MKTPRFSQKPTQKSARGFTLVEVALSLGVIAFAFVPMFGLLPLGLNLSHQAIDTTIASQVVQQLTTEAQQTDFSQLSALGSTSISNPYYFDDQGNLTSQSATAIYAASLEVSPGMALPNNVSTTRLAAVRICILNTKANRTDHSTAPTTSRDAKRYTVLIPDNGR